MLKDLRPFLAVTLLSISVKLLLIPSKFSTDFEVHRNWLAITTTFPISEWYTENGSIWTLDYPPFFAYFEMMLGYLAKLSFPASKFWFANNYLDSSFDCIIFQKLSVIISDFLFYIAIFYRWKVASTKSSKLALLLLAILPHLFIIDHIHFQYNGFLIGIFLFCLEAFHKKNLLIGSVLFTILICFKHIFIVFAPVLGLFVISSVVSNRLCGIFDFLLIAYNCIKVIMVAFTPFIMTGQIFQVVHRLFPVQRGLLHSYWAPNFWALYSFLDLLLRRFFIFKPHLYQRFFNSNIIPSSDICNGLTGEKSFSILPDITPFTTIAVIGILHMPITYILLKQMNSSKMIRLLFISGLISFIFGYHVHEKASIPFLALSLFFYDLFDDYSKKCIENILIISAISLIPLMQENIETCIALSFSGFLLILFWQKTAKLSWELMFQISYTGLYIYIKNSDKGGTFLPLLLVSVCSAGLIFINSAKLYLNETMWFNKK